MPEEVTTTNGAPAQDPGQAPQNPPAPSKDGGQANPDGGQDDLPEKFKGKTPSEIAKSYIELEKKLGDNSRVVNQTRQQLEQWQALGRVLESNPQLYKQVEAEIDKLAGKKPDSTVQDPAPTQDKSTRTATENLIITRFEERFGIDRLPSEKRTDMHKRIGAELAEMLDPGGNKNMNQIMQSIDLTKLDRYLEKAYKLATVNDETEKARVKAILEHRTNSEASFSSVSSSGLPSNQTKLTPEQEKVAARLGVSPEKYLEQLKKMDEE